MDYLIHHGILGMKWGIRRYQNKDGSLTPEGRKRVSEKYKELSTSDYLSYDKKERDKLFKDFDNLKGVKQIRKKMSGIYDEQDSLKRIEQKYWNFDNSKRDQYVEKLFQEQIDPVHKWKSKEERDEWKEYYLMEDDYSSYPNSFSYYLNDNYSGGYKQYESDKQKLSNEEYELSIKYAKEYLGEFGDEVISNYSYSNTVAEDFANLVIRRNR